MSGDFAFWTELGRARPSSCSSCQLRSVAMHEVSRTPQLGGDEKNAYYDGFGML
jgi:hypothetical protein